jgi:alpha-glucosidase
MTQTTLPADARLQPWWRHAVVYQLYVRSFADSDGDGIGDLAGIIQRMEHLAQLGVDAVWLNPCYPSPQLDHGYDVADFFDIEPAYGDLATFDRLVAEARRYGIKVLMDIVPNHCSSQHAWFQAALAAAPGSPERSRFYFRDGRGEHGELPPNNWVAVFGGPAWTRITEADGTLGQWYLHTFTPWQPDFDWSSPDVVDMFDRALRFWFDRGVEGFRVDAVAVAGKAPGLPDAPTIGEGTAETDRWAHNPYTVFWPSAHESWKHWRAVIDDYERAHPGRQLVTVSEAYTPGRPDLLLEFIAPDEFHQSFCFDLMLSPWNAPMLRTAIDDMYRALSAAGASMTWTLNNHDTQRSVTRYGREDATSPSSFTGNNLVYTGTPVHLEVGAPRARAAALLALALPGAIYLYQGEELGLPEVLDLPDEAREDPIFVRTEGREIGRDGCRVPMPWTTDPASTFGFSESPSDGSAPMAPWLPVPADWGRYAASVQAADPDSMLATYREAIAARRGLHLDDAPLEWLETDAPDVLAFRRGALTVLLNVGSASWTVPASVVDLAAASVATCSRPDVDLGRGLPGDTAVWLVGQLA